MSNEKKFYSWARWYTGRGQSEENPAEFVVGYVSATKKQSEIPLAVTFPVSEKYDVELQKKRASDYADYLNKLDEAAKIAYDQIHLVDILKR
jgi:hypothetical protein